MGHRSSKTAPENIHREEDRHSAWGSDIDEAFCGPGTICADEWTPYNSLPPSPETLRRRFSETRIEDVVITEQPRIFDHDEDNITNYDVMTIREVDDFEIPPVLVAPVTVRSRKKKRKKLRRKLKSGKVKIRRSMMSRASRRNISSMETPVLRSYSRLQYIRKLKHQPRHRTIIVRRIRIHQDPRYPAIPPPNRNHSLKFRRWNSDDVQKHLYSKAIPPRHLKGRIVSEKPHFRYRGIPTIIV